MIKPSTWILGIALAGLLGVTGWGCKRSEPAPRMPKYYNVEVNLPKLRKTLEVPGLDVTNQLRQITMRMRYGQMVDAIVMLDKIKDNPAVTDPQKQVIDELIGQIKQAAQAQEAARQAPPH
jgi:hypothetical protein